MNGEMTFIGNHASISERIHAAGAYKLSSRSRSNTMRDVHHLNVHTTRLRYEKTGTIWKHSVLRLWISFGWPLSRKYVMPMTRPRMTPCKKCPTSSG